MAALGQDAGNEFLLRFAMHLLPEDIPLTIPIVMIMRLALTQEERNYVMESTTTAMVKRMKEL